ncbi:MAG TPA: DUF4386 domain-containing protein [Pyrinomonadaceae bacterium]|nr:DUF4386 domain-containing protein [Pyrinomonadaceae bacterium]
MQSEKSVGRIIGVLFLVQVLLAPPVYTQWGMLGSATAPDFLANAAGSATQIRVGVLLTFVLSALTLAAALIALPVFRKYSERLAFLFLALTVVGLATQVIESVATRDLLAMSLMYTNGDAPKEFLEPLGALARSTWTSAHFANLMLGHVKAFAFFMIIYRFALVPRVLGGIGMAATVLSTTAATMPLLGYRFSYPMIAPAALTQLALTLWLIVKGFKERQHAGAA